MRSREEILRVLDELKVDVKKKYGVKRIGLFGSFVSGGHKSGSDIDVLVEFDEVPDLFKFLELERYLEEILAMKVDLVRKKSIREELRESILSEVVYV